MSKKNKQKIASFFLAICVVVVSQVMSGEGFDLQRIYDAVMGNPTVVKTVASLPAEGTAEVHFINIGQGSAILIKGSDKNVLIDAGESKHAPIIIEYLEENGVASLDYMINTHPHYDHMGGCVEVMEAVPTTNMIMTPISENAIPTTRSYANLLTYLEENKESVTASEAVVGDVLDLGSGLLLNILGPLKLYDDLNDASIISRLDFGETFFLFCGDVENTAQQDLVDAGVLSKVNVVESPHHGSSTSVNEDFFLALSPDITVIQCSSDNSYGHPHKDAIALYDNLGIEYFRNDTVGHIKIVTDGKNVEVITEI